MNTVQRYVEFTCGGCGAVIQADEKPGLSDLFCVNCKPVAVRDSVPCGLTTGAWQANRRQARDLRLVDGISDVQDLLCDIAWAHGLDSPEGEKRAVEAGEQAMVILVALKKLVDR